MHNPKIIFFDIDDTLYRKETDTMRPSVPEAMRALKQRGILTAIATGRTLAALPAKIKNLIQESGIDMLVTINGQYTVYQNNVLQSYPIPTGDIERLCTFLDSMNVDYAFVSPHTIAVSRSVEPVHHALTKILPDYTVDQHYYRQHDVYQMLLFYGEDQDSFFNTAPALAGFKTIRWHEQSVDLLAADGSKARGIAQAVARLGIDMQDVMAFGDGLNDIEMMQSVGFGVAMGNAHPETKAVADYICPSVEEDGVLNGLKQLGVLP